MYYPTWFAQVDISATPVNPRDLVGIDIRVGALALGRVNNHVCTLSFPSRREHPFPASVFHLSISLCNPSACDSALIEDMEKIHTIAGSYDGSLKSSNVCPTTFGLLTSNLVLWILLIEFRLMPCSNIGALIDPKNNTHIACW